MVAVEVPLWETGFHDDSMRDSSVPSIDRAVTDVKVTRLKLHLL